MKISNELVEEICANVLAEHLIERDEESSTTLMQVVWEMGNGIEYETAIHSIIEEAIKADRAQRRLPYDTAELQGALDNNDPAQLLEIVNDIHTYQFYIEEEED